MGNWKHIGKYYESVGGQALNDFLTYIDQPDEQVQEYENVFNIWEMGYVSKAKRK